MRSTKWLVGSAALGLAAGLGAAIPLSSKEAWGEVKTPTIGVDEIKEGMKGFGLSVFKGYEPEKFDVEVINVLHNFRPGQDLIVTKTSHPRLTITRNVQGMSGSPIYLEGRLAGAYAYSFSSFVTEPVAGVTPIGIMLKEMRRPVRPGFWPVQGRPPLPGSPPVAQNAAPRPNDVTARYDGAAGEYDLVKHAQQVAQVAAAKPDSSRPIVPVATPLLLGGMGDRTARSLKSLFEPMGLDVLQAGGSGGTVAGAPEHFVSGGSLGVQFMRGDISAAGVGTVTYVEGTKIAGFGHPMANAGDTAIPTCISKVLWVWASDQHSFKIAECTRPLGTLVQDRQSAVVVDETQAPPMFPVDVRVEGEGVENAPRRSWHAEVIDEKFMSPALVSSVLGSIVEATVSEKRDVTWWLDSKITISGHGTLNLQDFGISAGGTPEAQEWFRHRVVRAIGDVLNNPWELTRIEKVEAVLKVEYKRDLLRLRASEVLDPVVDAGEKARIRVHLLPANGKEEVRILEVRMPPELAGRDVDLDIVPGYAIAPDLASPESLNELLSNETRQHLDAKSLVVQYRMPGTLGVVYRGHVTARLPSFALDGLRSTTADSGPETIASVVRAVHPIGHFVEGTDKVRVHVRSSVR